jgi:hypothetical protein
MFGKYNGFVSKAWVSACMYFLVRDNEFINSRKVLEGRTKNLRRDGFGKQPNKAKILICGKAASWEEKPSLVDNILNV